MKEATKNHQRLKGTALVVLSGIGIATLALGLSDRLDGADHVDSPNTRADQAADIADVYAFQRNGNLVLAMTISEIQTAPDLLLGESIFDPRVLYQFNLDDVTDGDEEANLVVQAFALGNPKNQQMRIVGPVAPEMGGTQAKIVNGRQLKVKVSTDGKVETGELDGVKAFAGVRDDPFFFDFVAFSNIINLRQQGILDERVAFRPAGEAVDTFAGLNVYAIVVEISPDRLNGIPIENLRVWANTSR